MPESGGGCGFRHVIMLLGCLANIVSYTDRSSVSLAIVPMAEEFQWLTKSAQGSVLSAFFFGYIVTQVLGGVLSQRYGPKRVVVCAVFLWSTSTIIMPWCAFNSLGMLFASRVVLGIGEGVLLPCLHDIAVAWVPPHERATAACAITSGQFAGNGIAMLAAPLVQLWWPGVFYLFGTFGIVWCFAFLWLATSKPEESRRVRPAELGHIKGRANHSPFGAASEHGRAKDGIQLCTVATRSDSCHGENDSAGHASSASGQQRPEQTARQSSFGCCTVPWRRFLCSRATFAIFAAHCSHNWSWYLLLSWLPTYLTEQGADLQGAGFLAVLPQLVAFILANAGAALADRILLQRLGLPTKIVRRLLGTAAHFGPALSLAILAIAHSSTGGQPGPYVSTSLATVAIGLGALVQAAFWTNIMDVAPRHAGILLGISNTLATLPGILCNLSTGQMLEEGGAGWVAVFSLAASIELTGGLVFVSCAEGRPTF
jgi:ACS family sodium-dependent inorganic phosphate cotransporter